MGNTVKVNFDGDGAGAIKNLQRIAASQETVIRGLQKMVRESKTAGREAQKMSTTFANVGKFLAGGAVFGKAASVFKAGLADINAERQGGMQRFLSQEASVKALGQIADTPGDMKNLMGRVKAMRYMEGMNALDASTLVFNARSQGRDLELGMFGKISRFADPIAMLGAVNSMQTALGPKETGDSRALVNKLLVAAKKSDLNAQELAPNVLTPAGKWGENKWKDESLIGAMGALASAKRSPEQVGTSLLGFANMAGKTFADAGGSFMGAVERFQRMSPSKLKALLQANVEFSSGYNMITNNMERIRSTTGEVDAAQWKYASQDMLSERLGIMERTPDAVMMRNNRIEAERRMIDEELRGRKEAIEKTAIDRELNRTNVTDGGGMRWQRKAVMKIPDALNMGPESIETASKGYDTFASKSVMGNVSDAVRGVGHWLNIADAFRELRDALTENTREMRRGVELGSD